VVCDSAVAFHEGGRSMGAGSPRRLYFAARNHLLLARRAGPAAGRLATAWRTASIVALNIAHALRSRGAPLGTRLSAVARGCRDYASGRLGSDA
jgi:hypothetical protein